MKGTSVGVATDINGKFIIESPVVKSPVLVFSFVGMLNKEVTVSSDAPLNVVLEDEEKVLDDVIVTGYRSISKTTFTGSSTKLQQDDIKLKGVMDVSRMLEGARMCPELLVLPRKCVCVVLPLCRVRISLCG